MNKTIKIINVKRYEKEMEAENEFIDYQFENDDYSSFGNDPQMMLCRMMEIQEYFEIDPVERKANWDEYNDMLRKIAANGDIPKSRRDKIVSPRNGRFSDMEIVCH